MAGLSFLLIILYALLQSEKKQRAQEKLKGMKIARDTEKRANTALVEGLKREQKAVKNIDTSKRDHFSK